MSKDPINPPHYQNNLQTCDAILSQLTDEEKLGFLKGQIAKYVFRFGKKNVPTVTQAMEDIKKSMWYSTKLYNLLDSFNKDGKKFQYFDGTDQTNVTNFNKKKKW